MCILLVVVASSIEDRSSIEVGRRCVCLMGKNLQFLQLTLAPFFFFACVCVLIKEPNSNF